MWLLQMLISFLLAISSYVHQAQDTLASKYRLQRELVAHTGFEPVISSLRGRCPKPLDECAVLPRFINLAGDPGFEPGLTDSESAVLPLDESPTLLGL